MNKIIIFGTGDIAQLANYYFTIDSEYEVVGFCVDEDYKFSNEFENKPLVSFEKVKEFYPPEEYQMFIALSYAQMNKLREEKYIQAKNKGYYLVNYISSKCSFLTQFEIGDNCFILEDNTIQPFVKLGSNITLWSGNHIGHHSNVKDNVFISSHVVISGHCTIEENSFLGVNSTIGHNVTIAADSLIGAGSIITKNTLQEGVYLPPKSIMIDRKSSTINL